MESVTVKTFDAGGATTRIEETTYTYNSSGIRVSALREVDDNGDGTNESVTRTEYLNDPHNHTGYSQVLQETVLEPATGHIKKRIVYTLGHNKIAQTTITYTSGAPVSRKMLVFGRDGHGSTRVLTEMAGAIATVEGVKQIFQFDAHGNLLNMTAAGAATSILFAGEMLDSGTGWYYNRARWYDPTTGRFNRMDPFFGVIQDPQSLHKYLYVHGDPVNMVDPSGELALGLSLSIGLRVATFGSTAYGVYDAANRVYQAGGISGLRWYDALTFLPGAGYFGAAIKYGRSVQRFAKTAQAFPKIAQKLHTVGGDIAKLAGRARSSLAGQLGTQVHQAFKASRFGRMFKRLQSFTSPASQWFRVTIDQPLSLFGIPGMGPGSKPDFTLMFPKFRFAIAIDVKPVPKAIYKKGFLQAQDYLYQDKSSSVLDTRKGTKRLFEKSGYKTLYFYLPYPSFVK